jgi:gliding motility-associated-like protein
MDSPAYVLGIIYFILHQFKKVKHKVIEQIASGKFPVYTTYQNEFGSRSKVAIAIIIGLVLFKSSLVKAQTHLGPFVSQPRITNPLREPLQFSNKPAPTFVDLDADGDQDVIVASFYGGDGFDYLKNEGTVTSPAFVRTAYPKNPIDLIAFDNGATPALADLDGDGDQDLLVGTMNGTFKYYKNTGTTGPAFTLQSGPWDASTKTGNPLNNIDLGEYASPVFMDLDLDGDKDIIVGTSFLPANKSIAYYVNDGVGNFSEAILQGINPNLAAVTPAFLDVDQDGKDDIILGADDGRIYYFKRTGTTSFEEQTGSLNPFNGIDKGTDSSPAAADIDNDGDSDLILGAQNTAGNIYYFINKGNSVFEEKLGFDNPFDGVDVSQDASPYFTDIDNDNDLDILIGNRIGSQTKLILYKNTHGSYQQDIANNPFLNLDIPNSMVPALIDLDGDGDKDLVGGVDNSQGTSIEYFKNENRLFVRQSFSAGPFKNIAIVEGKTDFVDIDADGDYDLFISDSDGGSWDPHYLIRFFKNTGTPQSPVFTEFITTENPLSIVDEQFEVFPRFADVDHDGDYDALIGEGGDVIEYADGNEFSYYENTGTATAPVFTYRGDLIPQGDNPFEPSPAFVDQDNDGDLDVFIGDRAGYIAYFKNNNPAPTATLNSTPLNVSAASGQVIIDSQLTLADADNDLISKATVFITDFQAGKEVLKFTAQAGITGSFNTSAGILTFQGSATVATYQALLRTVALEYSDASAGGRARNSKSITVVRTISIQVFDVDNTISGIASRVINIVFNQPPVFTDKSIDLIAGRTISVDLSPLVADVDGNIDLTSLLIVTQPGSGAKASVDASHILSLDYKAISFTGTETVTLQVCDQQGLCDQGTIAVTVKNTSPIIKDQQLTIPFGSTALVDLKSVVSDADDNIDLNSLTIVAQPTNGAKATINTSQQLAIDYSSSNFSGSDQLQVKVCDVANACAQNVITILVTNASPVIEPLPVSIRQGSVKILNLLSMTSDPDGNLDPATITIVQLPISGAMASVGVISPLEVNLTLDYSAISFSGTDHLTIRACDRAGACTESILSIEIDVTNLPVEVFNAVAPNSNGDNKFMRILNLPQQNEVSIFNRWGDVVFQVGGYDNAVQGKRFEGLNDNGNALSSGTYFYKVEFVDSALKRQTLTGYLSLKQ